MNVTASSIEKSHSVTVGAERLTGRIARRGRRGFQPFPIDTLQLMALFLGQSLVVACIGIVAGLGLGLLFVEVRNPFMHFINWLFSVEVFPASIYNFSELPAVKNGWDIARICGAAFVLCVLAGLAPAWNAGRLRPVEALRHE